MTKIKGVVFLALALLPGLAAAQTVYKYQHRDGTIVYSDTPIHGAKLIGQFQLVPLPPQETRVIPAQPSGSTADERARARVEALNAADAEIKAAEQALKEAQERQQAGVEPLPGERLGTRSPTGRQFSHFTPEYFDRQRQLADDVDAAQARLDQAYKIRNDLRD